MEAVNKAIKNFFNMLARKAKVAWSWFKERMLSIGDKLGRIFV